MEPRKASLLVRLLRWIPCALLIRSLVLCWKGCDRIPTFRPVSGVHVPTGYLCRRCGCKVDLNGGFERWSI